MCPVYNVSILFLWSRLIISRPLATHRQRKTNYQICTMLSLSQPECQLTIHIHPSNIYFSQENKRYVLVRSVGVKNLAITKQNKKQAREKQHL